MPKLLSGRVRVSVPATSANLGQGFDSLGLALGLRDVVTAEVTAPTAGRSPEITVSGVGAGEVPLDEAHLVYQAMCRAFAGMDVAVPSLRLHCENVVPHSRGLGSSSAAIVAGICAARALVGGGSLLMDDQAALALAAAVEGHPDNVAAALLGGFTIVCPDRGGFLATGMAVDPRIEVVLFVPPGPVDTRTARGLLPELVPHAAAAENAGRAALLVTALSRSPELLLVATEDLLHQEYRQPAMPQTLALVHRLRDDGIPAVVSGAGPAVLAFVDASTSAAAVDRSPPGWRVLTLPVDNDGVRVTVDEPAAE